MSVTFKGAEATLEGKGVNVGDIAPKVELVAKDLSTFSVGNASNKFQILIAVPSLDTGVCASEARKFNEKIASKDNVEAVVISMDLPFAMGRFCSTEGIENLKVGSDFRGAKFAKEYGILLANTPLQVLCARAIFVINPQCNISYTQIVAEFRTEQDHQAVLDALK